MFCVFSSGHPTGDGGGRPRPFFLEHFDKKDAQAKGGADSNENNQNAGHKQGNAQPDRQMTPDEQKRFQNQLQKQLKEISEPSHPQCQQPYRMEPVDQSPARLAQMQANDNRSPGGEGVQYSNMMDPMMMPPADTRPPRYNHDIEIVSVESIPSRPLTLTRLTLKSKPAVFF